MQELQIQVNAAGNADEHQANVRFALARGLPEFAEAKDPLPPNGKTLVLVGSGPSLPSYVDAIREERKSREVWAVKGAHDYLVDRGIIPHAYINLDPRDRRNTVQKPQESTEYFIASRCPPVMFDHLEGYKVTLWHSYSFGVEKWPEFKGKSLVQGGTTSGIRAIHLGWARGYRDFVMYGYDSCLAPDGQTKRVTGEKAGAVIDVIVNGRQFFANHAMAQQARDWRDLLRLVDDCTFTVVGDGLLAAIHTEFHRLKRLAA